MIARVLRAFGLVTSARYAVAVEQLRKADARAARLREAVDEAHRKESTWKSRTEKLEQASKQAEQALKRAERDGSVMTLRLEKVTTKAATDAENLQRDLARTRERLREAERDLTTAREHLMGIEVKLDILEGAANVLDRRTRRALTVAAPAEIGPS